MGRGAGCFEAWGWDCAASSALRAADHHALYKNDFKKMVTTECPQFVQNINIENLFRELDINSDNAINFEEFLAMVIKVGVASHKDSHKE